MASRNELLSITSGSDIVGECVALTVTYIICPVFTFSPAAGDCSRMQSGPKAFT